MKKILALLTGIVLLVAILVTCGGRTSIEQKGPKQVTIYLKALELNGEMHLIMHDSNNPGDTVIDNLVTVVYPEDIVKWKKDVPHSGIRKINQIRSEKMEGFMFSRTAELENDSIEYPIPPNAEPGLVKYVIVFTDTDGNIWCIDPYLKIPPPQ
jgi:hypothetical protein